MKTLDIVTIFYAAAWLFSWIAVIGIFALPFLISVKFFGFTELSLIIFILSFIAFIKVLELSKGLDSAGKRR